LGIDDIPGGMLDILRLTKDISGVSTVRDDFFYPVRVDVVGGSQRE